MQLHDVKLYLSADDVLLRPMAGILNSRKEAKLRPFIMSAPMDTITGAAMVDAMLNAGEIPVLCRYLVEEWPEVLNAHKNHEDLWVAVGADLSPLNDKELVNWIHENNTKLNVAVDIAHGASPPGLSAIQALSELPYVRHIMSGSVATSSAASAVFNAGADYIRIGIGPGSVCTTRLMTGVGMPQLSAINEIYSAFDWQMSQNRIQAEDVPKIIADGGIRNPGDAVKYLAAGADYIMMGSVFKACPETAGWTVEDIPVEGSDATLYENFKYKRYRGQASESFQKSQGFNFKHSEGAETDIIAPGAFALQVIEEFRGGVASALSYLGLQDLDELTPMKVEFIRVTSSTLAENKPHAVVAQ